MNAFHRLVSAAARTVPGPDATRVLSEVREAKMAQFGQALIYELVLHEPAARDWSHFFAVDLPKMLFHFDSKRQKNFPYGPHVVVALWDQPSMHLFDARAFFAAVAEIENLDEAELEVRLRGESKPPTRGPLLLSPKHASAVDPPEPIKSE